MRGKQAIKRKIKPDLKYNSLAVAKFINYLMRKGKKSTSQGVVYGAFDLIKEKTNEDPLVFFDKAMKNVTPTVEVKGKRIGGANYQIPMPVKAERKVVLASRWVIEAAQKRKGMPMSEKLASELMDAANNVGEAIKKRQDVHRMAEANRAFAHFAR
ncbi:30S ribosomal protein S7 [Candidatus Uhrbacteria bacterium]|nr:30S ribosomal protein S7 [Candidatus Uhrbacteria bacterium]